MNINLKNICISSSLLALIITSTPQSAIADDKNDILKILGGVAAGVVIGNMNKNAEEPQEQEDIMWNDKNTKPVAQRKVVNTDVKEVQNHLKKLGYYDGQADSYV